MNLDRVTALLSKLPVKHRDSGHMVPFRLFPNQVTAMKAIAQQFEEKRKIRAIFLKSRRVTVSSLCDSLLFVDCLSAPNRENLICAHVKDTSEGLFRVPRDLANALNERANVCRVMTKRIKVMHGEGASLLDIATAGTVASGRGLTLSGLHLCLRGDALVMTHDGNLISISSLRAGDTVWTHSGSAATVKAVSSRPAEEVSAGGKMLELRCWLNFERLVVTPDHEVWTRRGWLPAKELRPRDEIGTAIRPIRGSLHTIRTVAYRDVWGRKKRGQDVHTLVLNHAFGFFCGYYLAEGNLHGSTYKGKVYESAVCLAHHRDEKHFSSRAVAGASDYITSTSTRNKEGKRAITVVYGAALCRFLAEHFGQKDEKRIPDWVFDAPPAFVEGIVLGYLAGDGSKGVARRQNYECPTVYATSVRPRLLYQLRHLLAALGWGWGGITFEKGSVDNRGVNNRPSWTISISGSAALKIRKRLALDSVRDQDVPRRKRSSATKYKLADGYVWTQVRSIARTDAETVWDIEVDHPDHSFETVIGAVANSEAAQYPGQDSFLSLLPAVSKGDNSSIYVESTAFGKTGVGKSFYDFWQKAVARRNEYITIFLGWLTDPACVADEQSAADAPATDLERELMAKPFHATRAQIAWMRNVLESECQGYEKVFLQEYPHTPSVAFISTGDPAFTPEEINFAETTCSKPIAQGHMEWRDGKPHFVKVPSGSLHLWEEPKVGHKYYVGMDAAVGIESGDFAALSVWDGSTGRQVAQYADKVVPEVLAFLLNAIGHWYNRALLNGELTGNSGREVLRLLRDRYMYPNFATWKGKDDKILGGANRKTPTLWWEMTAYSRRKLFDCFRIAIRAGMKGTDDKAIVRDPALWQQMADASLSDWGRWEVERGHDDILVSAMLAVVAIAQNPVPRLSGQSHVADTGEGEDDQLRRVIPNVVDDAVLSLRNHYKKAMALTRKSQARHLAEGRKALGLDRLQGI